MKTHTLKYNIDLLKYETPEEFQDLFDTKIYKIAKKGTSGAGYYKYYINRIRFSHPPEKTGYDEWFCRAEIVKTSNQPALCDPTKGFGQMENSNVIVFEIIKEGDTWRLETDLGYVFFSALEYFVHVEESGVLAYYEIKKGSQYLHELSEITTKNPEYFV